MASKTYLITGANRGLGRALVETLLSRPNTTVIACVRDPNSPTSLTLPALATTDTRNLIILRLDSSSESTMHSALRILQSTYSISTIDVVIANAGISNHHGPALTTPLSKVRENFEINSIAVLGLFQATYPLLATSQNPVFVAMSTDVASIGGMEEVPIAAVAYGMSKAALNYLVRKIHFENEGFTAFVIHPGWIKTDMGNTNAVILGKKEAPVDLKESVDKILKKIDNATRKSVSGTFQCYDDTQLVW